MKMITGILINSLSRMDCQSIVRKEDGGYFLSDSLSHGKQRACDHGSNICNINN